MIRRPPSMADVAVAAGVSPVKVSRTFKPDTAVGKATRAGILPAAEAPGLRVCQHRLGPGFAAQ